ncbi:hypothetical protein ACS0TY_016466 [Phlomoides rotata]
MEQLKLMLILLALCLLVPLNSAKSIDVHYCGLQFYPFPSLHSLMADGYAEYGIKVSGVDISPFPVPRGKLTTFAIAASTDTVISGGIIKIDVSYFGFHVHNEEHELCEGTLCPIPSGDFVLSRSIVLPRITPPGWYTFRMSIEDEHKKQLTCFTFEFSIRLLTTQPLSDV